VKLNFNLGTDTDIDTNIIGYYQQCTSTLRTSVVHSTAPDGIFFPHSLFKDSEAT